MPELGTSPHTCALLWCMAALGVLALTCCVRSGYADVERVAKKDDALVVACMMGGTVKPSTNFPVGKESRYGEPRAGWEGATHSTAVVPATILPVFKKHVRMQRGGPH